MNKSSKQVGFTLIELLMTVAILLVFLVTGLPGMASFFDSKRVIGAAEQVYSHIQQARSEAIARNTTVSLNFSVSSPATTTWSYGLSTLGACDLAQTAATDANACTLVIDDGDGTIHGLNSATDNDDLVLMRFSSADHQEVSMGISSFDNGTNITFDPMRGTAIGNTGSITLTSDSGVSLMVKVGALGQVRICSPDGAISRYSDSLPSDNTDC
jgi:prepilin-type N-terminal cleavage/methylation domain-containing protein